MDEQLPPQPLVEKPQTLDVPPDIITSTESIKIENQNTISINTSNEIQNKPSRNKILFVILALIIFILILGVSLFILLTPTVNKLSLCIKDNIADLELLTQRGLGERWDNHTKCIEIKIVNEKLLSCYKKVDNESVLPSNLAFTFGGLFNTNIRNSNKISIIKLHNTNCSQYPDTLIEE